MTVKYSAPIPTRHTDTSDMFVSIFLGAPNFELLNKAVKYEITLDMMMDALRKGIENVSAKSRSAAARVRYQECLEQVDMAHCLYREGKEREAGMLLQDTWGLFHGRRIATKTGANT